MSPPRIAWSRFAYLSNIYMDSYANYEYVGTQLESVVGPETYFIDTERFLS